MYGVRECILQPDRRVMIDHHRWPMQVGCGVGNTSFPLLEVNPRAFVHACDFSPTAVACVMGHPSYDGTRLRAFVADITTDRLADEVGVGSVDICTMIFVLSAISPSKMKQVDMCFHIQR